MQVIVEDVSSIKKILHVEVPREKVSNELDKAYAQVKKNAKIRGFRPGKAPRSVLERLFKKDVHADVSSRLIQESFFEAVKEKDLKVIGTPKIDPPQLEAQKPFKYDATVEINPQIGDIDFKGLKLQKHNYDVGAEQIDVQLKMIQKRLGQLKIVDENRAIQEDDYALISYEGFKDGQPFAETQKTENYTLQIGKGQILKGFDDQLIGMVPGQAKEIKVQFPDDYFNANLAGHEIVFQVTLHEIREEVLPEIDDEFAKDVGKYETLHELKAEIRKHLKDGNAKRTEQELNEQIFQALIERTEFELPETMVEYELQGIIEETERSFAQQNRSLEDVGLSRETIAEKYRETAAKQVRRHLILNRIIEQEELKLSDDDLANGFREMSDSLQRPVEEIRDFYNQDKDKLEMFKHTLLEKQAIKLIIEDGRIEEVKPEPLEKAQKDPNAKKEESE